ncbi:cGMP-dependent protein kinase, isozyme 1 isoform X1 [Drosophila elegans]|uniref:cGMP-dependent protein kinase, isozyme 1 isoform X1 n=1 Tax=Drosophila elegans TaxID=30023 RepID=UPI0007E75D0E|nr:cGMP-dependent protein kinase, isozyme 1 isoform X1 [Drosophila elegans]
MASAMTDREREAIVANLTKDVQSLREMVRSRESELVKLHREIHKLKSVLQQTTNHLNVTRNEKTKSKLYPLPEQCGEQEGRDRDQNRERDPHVCSSCGMVLPSSPEFALEALSLGPLPHSTGFASTSSAATSSTSSTSSASAGERERDREPPPKAMPAAIKKQGVSAESCVKSMEHSYSIPIPKYDKDFSDKQQIKDAIMDNDFLKNIDASQVRELVDSMYSKSIAAGEFVIREGEVGAHLYVSAAGEFAVMQQGKVLDKMGPGKAFGELAILYNCTRTASIRVLSEAARVWVLDRRVFQQIMMCTGLQRIENSVNFLRSVPLLKNLSEELLAKIADVLELEFYAAGTYIIRQGTAGDSFFLISQGNVRVTQKLTPSSVEETELRTLARGDYFGEQALINEDKRTANIIALSPGVECLTLDRDSFKRLIGDLCELKEKDYGDESRMLAMKAARENDSGDELKEQLQQEFPDLKLTDLEVVSTLGIGGFGRVELVKAHHQGRVDTFALKCLKKRHIVDTKQEEHIYSERHIMLSSRSPFVCRLYRTFRDEKYVYMLLEACMGGEIWTMLRDRGSFEDNAAQFIIGCVLQAFEYLHARGIIYRDLKPENLMLDERGYVKIVDFGFAKQIGTSAKTWTFCGTPEYVAPEIILNKGHDRAVDYWALGILIHELLNGTPPFSAPDPMQTYNLILKGIDMIAFPKHISRWAVQLIKRLCRDVPSERLGYQTGGIQDIKKHKWFLGFDWDGLSSQLLIPPFVRPIAHPTDVRYFDRFPCDLNEPPDELSGWDADF